MCRQKRIRRRIVDVALERGHPVYYLRTGDAGPVKAAERAQGESYTGEQEKERGERKVGVSKMGYTFGPGGGGGMRRREKQSCTLDCDSKRR